MTFVTWCVLAAGLGVALPASPIPQPQASVPQMLDIAWSAGRPMPQGMQDNHVTLIHGWLISVCGFCGGADKDWKPGRYPRGFLNKVWGLDLNDQKAEWMELPPLPGAPRQAMQGTRLGNALYVWGGFSYSEPYTYRDGYRLSRQDGAWVWQALPPLPSPSSWGGSWTNGSRIYTVGGADYDRERFHTLTDRTGAVKDLGRRLMVFDTAKPEAGWTPRTPLPGTPRCLAATAVLEGKAYVIGGVAVTADTGAYCNVVDNWRYDLATGQWERLRDLPISGSGTSSGLLRYKNRYILLPCGYQYESLMRPEGQVAPKYGNPSTVTRTWEQHRRFKDTHYYNHCYVYDTQTDLFGTATALPFDDVASITVMAGDTAYLFPGETAGFVWEGEYYGHHPEFVLKGAVQELDWQEEDWAMPTSAG